MDAQDEPFKLISPPGIRRNSAGVDATHRDGLPFSPWAYDATPSGDTKDAGVRENQDSGYTIRVEEDDCYQDVDALTGTSQGHGTRNNVHGRAAAETPALENDDEGEDAPLLGHSGAGAGSATPARTAVHRADSMDSPDLRRELFGTLINEHMDAAAHSTASRAPRCCRLLWWSRCCAGLAQHVYVSCKTLTVQRKPSEQCLDGFRALAALWVLSFHIGRSFQEIDPVQWHEVGWLYQSLDAFTVALNGDMGVDVFLVLSGYLVPRTWLRVKKKYNGAHVPPPQRGAHRSVLREWWQRIRCYFAFALHRFLRLAPLLYLLVLMSIVFEPTIASNAIGPTAQTQALSDSSAIVAQRRPPSVHAAAGGNGAHGSTGFAAAAAHAHSHPHGRSLTSYSPRITAASPREKQDPNPCLEWWPVHLFMVANMYDGEHTCAEHAWTVSMMFQLSLLTPIVVELSNVGLVQRWESKCWWGCRAVVPMILIVFSTIARALAIDYQHMHDDPLHMLVTETHAGYQHPLYRGGPYWIGVALFCLVYSGENRERSKASSFDRYSGTFSNSGTGGGGGSGITLDVGASREEGDEGDEDGNDSDGGIWSRREDRETPGRLSSSSFTSNKSGASAEGGGARRSSASASSLGNAAKSRFRALCASCVLQVAMLLLLIWWCIEGVGTHRTFGSRRKAWIGWMHASSKNDPEAHVLHAVFGRTLFGVVVGYWVYMASTGNSMCAQWCMRWHGWAPIARLSYAAYLFTFLPVWVILPAFIERRSERLDAEGLRVRAIFVASFVSIGVCLYALAFVLVVLFEMPVRFMCDDLLAGRGGSVGDGVGSRKIPAHRRRSTWDMVQRQFGNYF
jgi:peptidoglycan/LPS O-acetylase OafA/YrhL